MNCNYLAQHLTGFRRGCKYIHEDRLYTTPLNPRPPSLSPTTATLLPFFRRCGSGAKRDDAPPRRSYGGHDGTLQPSPAQTSSPQPTGQGHAAVERGGSVLRLPAGCTGVLLFSRSSVSPRPAAPGRRNAYAVQVPTMI